MQINEVCDAFLYRKLLIELPGGGREEEGASIDVYLHTLYLFLNQCFNVF